jgi:hypothetical protein
MISAGGAVLGVYGAGCTEVWAEDAGIWVSSRLSTWG